MVAKTYILRNLKQLNSSFNRATGNPKQELYYSKLAVLELCGWIEESMDDIIIKCGNRCLKRNSSKKYLEINIVRRTYGFDYDRHFRSMLMRTIGLINLEKLERTVAPVKLSQLTSTLTALTQARNRVAHTHIKGITLTIDAPSVTIRHFHIVYDALKHFETILKKLKL